MGLPYYYASQKQFWQAWNVRRGFRIIKEGGDIKAQYEKMTMLICNVLPLQYDVVMGMDYGQFYRVLNQAYEEIERQNSHADKMKNKKKK